MYKDLTKEELKNRLEKFIAEADCNCPDWDTVFIVSRVNQYYFTGTMQDGLLVIKKGFGATYFVRKSFERALDESPLSNIYKMESYRDAANVIGSKCGNTYVETEVMTVGITERLKKYFDMKSINAIDRVLLKLRAVKTAYELEWLRKSGKKHDEVLKNIVPSLLREGMSEADFMAELFEKMVKYGYQGISRFAMFQNEIVAGQIGFGESSIYPICFDGPGGQYGMAPSIPLIGSRERKLKKGDLVFVDIAFGMNGYHTDKTQVYMFGGKPSDEAVKAHRACMDIEYKAAEMLKTGAVPADVYKKIMNELDDGFKVNFMGYGEKQAKFLGHGVGLLVDEYPIIANGFTDELKDNMVIALEPKKGIKDFGLVGVEDTYVVTKEGGECITGGGQDIFII